MSTATVNRPARVIAAKNTSSPAALAGGPITPHQVRSLHQWASMKTLRSIVGLVIFLVAAVRPAAADEVRLANGDRLTGAVVSLADGTLTFKTPHGDLKLPWAEVTALRIDQPLLVRTTAAPAQLMTLDSTAGTGPALSDIVEIAAPAPAVIWSGGANAGLLKTGGNTDISSLRLDGEVTARARADRYAASGVVNRAQDDGGETAENWTTSLTYNRFLNERLFVDASTIFTSDRFRDLDLRTALGAGIGYQVWEHPKASLSLNAGVGWVHENFDAADDDSYTALRESAKLDVFFADKRLQAFHHHDGYFGVTGDDNLFFRTQNGLRLALTAGLVGAIQLDVDYDRSPAPGRLNTDRSFALTLGYRF
jgi:putative salt-induced outer membrane protein YdiY